MDVFLFVLAKLASPLVDIGCPRGRDELGISIHSFLCCLHWCVLILHETFHHWSVAVLTVAVQFIYLHLGFVSGGMLSALNWIF